VVEKCSIESASSLQLRNTFNSPRKFPIRREVCVAKMIFSATRVCSFLEHKAMRQFPRCDANRRQSKLASHSTGESAHSIFAAVEDQTSAPTHKRKGDRRRKFILFLSLALLWCVWESRESLAAESHTLSWRTVNKYIACRAHNLLVKNFTLHGKKNGDKAHCTHTYTKCDSPMRCFYGTRKAKALSNYTLSGAPVPKSCAQFHSQFLRSFSARETPARPTSSVSQPCALDAESAFCVRKEPLADLIARSACDHTQMLHGIYVGGKKNNKLFQNKGPDAQNYGAFFG
jgi:hypothetical protein